jgi:SWI/SNF-related matrix-associated actin-dependent regulator of chromatin subfamily A-like protein 1
MPELVPEQEYGAEWLRRRPQALLADVMGYGKTAQALTAAKRAGARRVAVVCPAIARVNWAREAVKWGLDLPIRRITTPEDHLLPAEAGDMLAICSYDGMVASSKLRGAMNARGWDVLILDEAHRLKNAEANRTRAVYGSRVNGQRCLADKAAYRWLLTASPMPNDAGELWTHLAALWPGLIRGLQSGRAMDYNQFLDRYCLLHFGDYGTKVLGYKDREGLVALLDEIMLRRDEIVGLPDLVLREDPTLVDVGNAALARLEAHAEIAELRRVLNSADARANDLDAIEDDFIHLATLRRLTGVLKAKPAAELVLAETGPEDKVVLFAVHREVIEIMHEYFSLAGVDCAVVHGGVPDGKRNIEIDRFNGHPVCRVFIGQIEACKEVINLPAANRVRLVEQAWSPETNAQAIARVHRRGQTRQVFADAIAIEGSIDETVQRVLLQKARNIHAIMKERYNG